MLYDPEHARKRKQWSKARHILNGCGWVLCTPILIGAIIVRATMDVGNAIIDKVKKTHTIQENPKN